MKETFKKVLAMALAMTMAAGVLTGCGGKDPVADTSASGETAVAGSESNRHNRYCRHIYVCHRR